MGYAKVIHKKREKKKMTMRKEMDTKVSEISKTMDKIAPVLLQNCFQVSKE